MKEKNNRLLYFGIINMCSVFIVLCLSGIVLDLDGTKTGPIASGITIIILFILSLSPISCILGIVQGIRYWKRERVDAKACLILSIIGFLLFAVVIGFFWYATSRF